MRKRFARLLLALLGMCLGVGLAEFTLTLLDAFGRITAGSGAERIISVAVYVAGILFGLLLALTVSVPVVNGILRLLQWLEGLTRQTPATNVIFGAVGLALALLIAYLITRIFGNLPLWAEIPLSTAAYVLFAYLGVSVGTKRWREVPLFRKYFDKAEDSVKYVNAPKILDTSVIIDGRVFDLCKSGFLEGELVVPGFVLDELRHVADSADDLRRTRGRRGLDLLARMQSEFGQRIIVEEKDYPDVSEVDVKLLKLAEEMGGKIVTNDYNLSKVAGVTGTPALNVNELVSALKPVFLAGEEMTVHIVKEGKEPGQGVGYLDDGTMTVVESARDSIGQMLKVTVTSVLQTAAGRIIFARKLGAESRR